MNEKILQISKLPYNKICADCQCPGATWTSITLGIFICKRCAGIHRSFGTHISFVKSVTLDNWSAEQVKKMKEIGNEKAKLLYEHNISSTSLERPNKYSDDKAVQDWIQKKYIQKLYYKKDSPPENLVEKQLHNDLFNIEFMPFQSSGPNVSTTPQQNSQQLSFSEPIYPQQSSNYLQQAPYNQYNIQQPQQSPYVWPTQSPSFIQQPQQLPYNQQPNYNQQPTYNQQLQQLPHNQQPTYNQQPPYNQPNFNQQLPYNQSNSNQQPPYNQPNSNQQPPYNQPNSNSPYNQPNFNQQPPYNQPNFNQQVPYNQPNFNQQSPYNQPNFNQQSPYNQYQPNYFQ